VYSLPEGQAAYAEFLGEFVLIGQLVPFFDLARRQHIFYFIDYIIRDFFADWGYFRHILRSSMKRGLPHYKLGL
jgi:hypothetical protein